MSAAKSGPSGRVRFETPIIRRDTSISGCESDRSSALRPVRRSPMAALRPTRVVLVEGLIDVHQLRATGSNRGCIGGARLQAAAVMRLPQLGIESIVLAFDNDRRVARASRAVDDMSRAPPARACASLNHGSSRIRRIPTHSCASGAWSVPRPHRTRRVRCRLARPRATDGVSAAEDIGPDVRLSRAPEVAWHAAGSAFARAGGRDSPRGGSLRLLQRRGRTRLPGAVLGARRMTDEHRHSIER